MLVAEDVFNWGF